MLPKVGEESFARHLRREVGGGAAITACGPAKLGVQVAVMGAVGKEDGEWVIGRLAACGVDCSGLEMDPGEPTGLTVSVSTRKDRAFFSYYGANRLLPRLLSRPETLRSLKRARHVHFACAPDGELDEPLFVALCRARCRLSIDVQSHISWLTQPEKPEHFASLRYFFPQRARSRVDLRGERDTQGFACAA